MKRNILNHLMVSPETSLMDVLRVIDSGTVQAAIVVDPDKRMLGMVTDGDIRRALLSGFKLDSSVNGHFTTNFQAVGPDMTRAAALDLMLANRIEQLPIVDRGGELYGLHLLAELVGTHERPNWAVIMAGGRGTRLGKFTKNTPKPMIKIAGRPILERIVLQLVGGGVRKLFLAVNYLSEVIEDHFGDGSTFGCEINYLREEEPMGSGGALSLLPVNATHPVIVMNGDLITEFKLEGLLKTHETREARITVGVRQYAHGIPFGCIDSEDGLITGLREKPILEETINTGIYAISPEILQRVPRDFYPITNLIEGCLERAEKVACFHIDEWIDVGTPHHLAEALGEI